MRCMYRIWRHDKFFCERSPGSGLEELPSQICQDLKRIITFRIKALECDILSQFWKIQDVGMKPQERRLPLWACMMQVILMYRDIFALNRLEDLCGDPHQIQNVTTSLFSNLVVMCEICFGKKKPEALPDDGNPVTSVVKRQLNADFRRVETHRDEFYYSRARRSRLSAFFHARPPFLCAVDWVPEKQHAGWGASVQASQTIEMPL
ncbi:hypothetical protein GGR54DRAFT_233328 [Hypoxylon sp. NC1633]|nr:hypothetical protein GGR54DRAFT_233328 [Hypoxylon sp. NC1633]